MLVRIISLEMMISSNSSIAPPAKVAQNAAPTTKFHTHSNQYNSSLHLNHAHCHGNARPNDIAGNKNLIQLVGGWHSTFGYRPTDQTRPECRPHDQKCDGERDTRLQVAIRSKKYDPLILSIPPPFSSGAFIAFSFIFCS